MKKYSIPPLTLILAAAFILIDGTVYALFAVGFSLAHELAHIVTLRLCRGSVTKMQGIGFGVGLSTSALSYTRELAVVLAGPALSLLLFFCFLPFFRVNEYLCFACAANLAIFCVNILPIYPLDGGRALFCLLAGRFSVYTAARVTKAVSFLFLLPLGLISVIILVRTGFNLSLLIISIYLSVLLIGVKNI